MAKFYVDWDNVEPNVGMRKRIRKGNLKIC